MDIIIEETGKQESLVIEDPMTGLDWTKDCIGAGQYDYDDEAEALIMGQDHFDWWQEWIEASEAAERRRDEMRKSIMSDAKRDEFDLFINDAISDCEIGDQPEYKMDAMDDWEKAHPSDESGR